MAAVNNPTPAEIDSLKGKAWTAAARDLREKFKKDWETFLRARYHEYGLEWNPRKTTEEREREQLAELVTKHPDLARQLTQRQIDDDADK